MDVISFYRDLHTIPELSNKEYKTKNYVIKVLSSFRGRIYEVGDTCILFLFDFNKKETIVFRSDMDALPIDERIMHACGHDGHMAILLSFGEYINTLRDYKYNIGLLFQQGEETCTGAKIVLESNILNAISTKYIFGLHLWPSIEEGIIYSKKGPILASTYEVDIVFNGLGIHAANKDKGIDPIQMAMTFLTRLYEFDKTLIDKHLIYFGEFKGGTIRNVVPNEVYIKGTIRFFSKRVFEKISHFLQENVKYVISLYGGSISVNYPSYCAMVNNDKLLYSKLDFIRPLSYEYLQAEDFGFYCENYQCLFSFLGIGNKPGLHTKDFYFNEEVLKKGVDYFKQIIIKI